MVIPEECPEELSAKTFCVGTALTDCSHSHLPVSIS